MTPEFITETIKNPNVASQMISALNYAKCMNKKQNKNNSGEKSVLNNLEILLDGELYNVTDNGLSAKKDVENDEFEMNENENDIEHLKKIQALVIIASYFFFILILII